MSTGVKVCAALLCAWLLLAGAAFAEKHDLVVGRLQPGDRLLMEKGITRDYKFLGHRTADLTYSNPDAVINYIEVLDQKTDGHGGYATIESGGVGHHNVSIHFESQFSRGFIFTVKIHGR